LNFFYSDTFYIIIFINIMVTFNNDILYIICNYLAQKYLKKFSYLSKKYHDVAKYLLVHKFAEDDAKYINDDHHRIHLKFNTVPNIYHDKICVLNLNCSSLISLPESIGQLSQLQ